MAGASDTTLLKESVALKQGEISARDGVDKRGISCPAGEPVAK